MEPAPIDFDCPHCGQHIDLDDTWCGKTAACPTCDGHIIIPEKPRPDAKVAVVNFGGVIDDPDLEAERKKPEEEVFKIRPSIRAYIGTLIWSFVVVTAISVLLGVLRSFLVEHIKISGFVAYVLPFLLIFGGTVLTVWLKTLSAEYRLTTQRLFQRRGLIGRQIDEIETFRIKDVTLTQRMWQRLLGFGNVIVFSSDDTHSSMVLLGVADPMTIKEQIREESRASRRREGVRSAEFIPS